MPAGKSVPATASRGQPEPPPESAPPSTCLSATVHDDQVEAVPSIPMDLLSGVGVMGAGFSIFR